ncbi:hypothetical protein MHBO_003321, partial [Bonamia ostreae]
RNRWGFKCFIKGVSIHSTPFLIDLSISLSSISKNISKSLIKTPNLLNEEIFLKPWFQTLLSCGLTTKISNFDNFSADFIAGKHTALPLLTIFDQVEHKWLLGTGRDRVKRSRLWVCSIRAMVLAMLKHVGSLKAALKICNPAVAAKNVRKSLLLKIKMCVLSAKKLQMWMYGRAQALKTWDNLWHNEIAREKTNRDKLCEEFYKEYSQNSGNETIELLCQLKNVQYIAKNPLLSIEGLFKVLLNELGKPRKDSLDQVFKRI